MYMYGVIAASGWKWRYCCSLCLIVAVVLLTGCKVNQEKEQSYYQDVLRGENARAPKSLEPNQPLSLVTALEMANWHNEQLAIKGEEYLQALIDKDRAASNFLPQIAYIPTYTQQEKVTFAGASSFVGDFVLPHTFDEPVNAKINLNVPGDVANSKRAESAARQQRSLLLDLKSTVLLDVSRVYYQVLLAEAREKVLENSVNVQRDRVADIRSKYRAGTALKLDVVQVEAQLSQTQVSLIKARNDVSTGRATLAFLVNEPSVENSLSDTLRLPSRLPPNEQLLSTAWNHRDDFNAAAYQVEMSTHILQEAWSRYFPSISLNFTYFLSRQSFPSEVDWIGSLGLNLPIFSAGLTHDDVRTAWSMLRQAKLAEVYLQRQISKELTVAVENYNDIRKQAEELKIQVKAAEEQMQRSIYAYENGLATNLDTLIARDRLLNARLSLTEASFNEKIFFLNLMRILGRFDAESLASEFDELFNDVPAGVALARDNMEVHTESGN